MPVPAAGQQLTPEFLAVTPERALPALIETGQPVLTQSGAILEYLEERFPQPALPPGQFLGRCDNDKT